MSEIKILTGNVMQLKSLLGEIAEKLDLKPGDTTLTLETEEQVTVGRAVFESLITQGWSGYSVTEEGKTEKKLDEFDSSVFRTIMFGPIAGG